MRLQLRTNWHIGFVLLVSIFISIAILVASETGYSRVQASQEAVTRAMANSAALSTLLGLVADAETSQRGYLLTERAQYLETYNKVVPQISPLLTSLRSAFDQSDAPPVLAEYDAMASTVQQKLSELQVTLTMVLEGEAVRARELLLTDIGREKMDQLRARVAALQAHELERTAQSIAQRQFNSTLSRVAVTVVTLLNIVLSVFLVLWLRRDWMREQERQLQLEAQREHLDRLVGERTAQLEILASHLIRVSEREKSKIARELHDDLGTILTASKMDVAWVRQNLGTDPSTLHEKLTRALTYIDQGVQTKRRLIENLIPSTLTGLGLTVALRELAENMQTRTDWALTLNLPDDAPQLSEEASIALFRIAQEAINNAAKYAKANALWLVLSNDEKQVILEIEDDGQGFDSRHVRPKSHGLAGMRQRMMGLGGTLTVDSTLGRGTRIRATLPLHEPVTSMAMPL